MSLSRRQMLGVVGGGMIVAAGAGATGFLTTRRPDSALAPWSDAGAAEEPRRRALSFAILAPNPHNRQPWLVDLRTENTVILHRDMARDLPETDPFHRQLVIGLGCFLELLRIAAAEDGHAVSITSFPDGESGPVAIARFSPGGRRDPLFSQIVHRRSCKQPFEDRQVPETLLAGLVENAVTVSEPDRVAALRTLTWAALVTEMNTPRTLKESAELMRFGKSEINSNPDGIDLGGPFLDTLMLLGVVSREALMDPESSGSKEGLRLFREMLAATPAYAFIVTPGNSRAEQIDAGRRWVRLNLQTTAAGLALHPVSQALQEFPEMAAHYNRAHALLAPDGGRVQMLGRLGFGPTVPRSPRWPLETRISHG